MSREEIGSDEVLKQTDVLPEGGIRLAGWAPGYVEIQRIADHPEAYVTFRVRYKCKHCSKEWSRLETQEVELPKEYVEDSIEETGREDE